MGDELVERKTKFKVEIERQIRDVLKKYIKSGKELIRDDIENRINEFFATQRDICMAYYGNIRIKNKSQEYIEHMMILGELRAKYILGMDIYIAELKKDRQLMSESKFMKAIKSLKSNGQNDYNQNRKNKTTVFDEEGKELIEEPLRLLLNTFISSKLENKEEIISYELEKQIEQFCDKKKEQFEAEYIASSAEDRLKKLGHNMMLLGFIKQKYIEKTGSVMIHLQVKQNNEIIERIIERKWRRFNQDMLPIDEDGKLAL